MQQYERKTYKTRFMEPAREVYLDKAEGPGGIDVRKIDPRFYDLWKLTLADKDSTRLSESKLLRMPSSFNNQGGSQ